MDNPTKIVDAEATKVIEIALIRLASKMSDLTNETTMVYLWKWFPPCRGLRGKTLTDYLVQHGCGWSVADKHTDTISGKTALTYVFARPTHNIFKAAKLEFRVTTPNINKAEELVLEFGHLEIPFPADIKVETA